MTHCSCRSLGNLFWSFEISLSTKEPIVAISLTPYRTITLSINLPQTREPISWSYLTWSGISRPLPDAATECATSRRGTTRAAFRRTTKILGARRLAHLAETRRFSLESRWRKATRARIFHPRATEKTVWAGKGRSKLQQIGISCSLAFDIKHLLFGKF